MTVTNDDLAALSSAERVSFHHQGETGQHGMCAQLIGYPDRTRIFGRLQRWLFPETSLVPGDRARWIPCNSAIRVYSPDESGFRVGVNVSEENAHHSMIPDRQWQTTVYHLLANDQLALRWAADGNTYTREARLHLDTLRLQVIRDPPGADLLFGVATQVCADNSARMIQT